MILLDTNILIEVLKNNQNIIKTLYNQEDFLAISSITAMELYFGALNKKEMKKIEKFLTNFETIHLSENISKEAERIIKKYSKSHNLDIPDSLIAATAIVNSFKLFTLNKKDFNYIDKLKLLEV